MDISDSWDGNHGTLSVYVSKAKDLPNLIKLDKQNVMLRLRIAHMTRESDTLFRAGQNPVFNYLERFEMTPAVQPLMYVEVYCDRKKKAPLQIGRCEIDLLNGIRADPKEGYCKWYELKREQNEFAGIIFIELTFKPTIDVSRREQVDERTMRLDASMASRPMPPLPTEFDTTLSPNHPISQSNSSLHSGDNLNYSSKPQSTISGAQPYMHQSEMRQMTPLVERLNLNGNPEERDDIMSFSPDRSNGSSDCRNNFMSSMGSSNTATSTDTKATAVSTTSETKFHFANLRKLKEKINIFKNPSVPNTDAEDNSVDIEALQKAIGVSSTDEKINPSGELQTMINNNRKESKVQGQHRYPTEDHTADLFDIKRNDNMTYSHSRREETRHNRKTSNQPIIPPLPSNTGLKNSRSSSPHKHIHNYMQENRYDPSSSKSPMLPPLPTSPRSRGSSMSPTRRRPPPTY
ncbi:similar to Saccharomyces cerevisiae YNL152W INN1 Essential protein that associates with the contractile actomyosin ring [Maudiozyma saulgeensis]|uniref:Similar to Saccharomyces cerevisiae YNL152W INN1 Essential protein that associates with the contractile actomyosin ring n=1 Tax=Maudiozyma saulgeensis TaxID=1789683 RepID=A0A1X7QYE4_9SACH|nr:similar to Saccharomyces cerevisiae YNL152W INN1 Essential protein that associates with the contractile actomyosin ring [Kazachstania saulgeensis]